MTHPRIIDVEESKPPPPPPPRLLGDCQFGRVVNLKCCVVQELKSSTIDLESIVGGGERRTMILCLIYRTLVQGS
jgi:hypothetical protein